MSKEAINKARELFSSLPWQMKYIPIRVEEVLSTQMNITLCYTDIDTEDGYTVKYKGNTVSSSTLKRIRCDCVSPWRMNSVTFFWAI